ncbi:hypothetical protein Nepgr_017525 [Nepenthes gracilis]|uniref:SPX domain-containing protein n=1 Tax=Nepenthes gracilis TaxID=150966 RepID=A0AAD3SRS2_NEPGR|nr:hypothetical protein Nepgr_017525 [Nepenthes gracilis]
MKFGKEFRTHLEESLPGWRDKFLCYKPLKKLIKHCPNTAASVGDDAGSNRYLQPVENDGRGGGASVTTAAVGLEPNQGNPRERTTSLVEFQEWFVRLINDELEKFNDFYVEKEEEFIIRFQELKERIESVKEKRSQDGAPASMTEFSEEMMGIRKDFVTIHGEMVLLENYSSLNFAGLVKILKKYDKRTGGVLQLPFTQLLVHQPFFTTDPLTRLVRECEANIELLFPPEEEVVESTPAPSRDQFPPGRSLLGEVTLDIYRSTVSAMRTIQGLRTSSTCNPLSIAAIFASLDKEDSGVVTAEDSASISAPLLQEENLDREDDAGSSAP